jgi:hypothetical protein
VVTIGLVLLIVSLIFTNPALSSVGLAFMFAGGVALMAGVDDPLGRLW